MILYSVLAAGATDPTQLPIWALGPVAVAVLLLFITQLVVPGPIYKKLDEDYRKSRELNEKVIPLAERMTESQADLARAMDRVTTAMEDVLDGLARNQGTEPPPAPPARRRTVR